MTRQERMQAAGSVVPMPPLGAARHLVEALFDAGPVGYGAMGIIPLTHSEIAAWQANTGAELEAWQAQALRRLSHDYVSMSQKAESETCTAPYFIGPTQETRDAVARAIAAAFPSKLQGAAS